jgi:pimeloyl-ACP methyl ester carboxylesterase
MIQKSTITFAFANSSGAIHSAIRQYVAPIILFTSIVLFVSGCATPVGIDHVDIQTGYQINNANAMSAGEASEASKMVLRRHDMLDRFETEPVAVLTELHKGLRPTGHDTRLFALAELSLLHAQRTNDRAYFLASAVYAWSLLFPEDGASAPLPPSDPRFRLTYDIYNQAIALGLAAPNDNDEDEDEVLLKSGKYKLPFGSLDVTLDQSGMTWGGYPLDRFISTNTIDVRGLRNRYRTAGIGTPLAASLAARPPSTKLAGSDRLGPKTKVPVTALLRLNHARSSLASGKLSGQLEVYAADQSSIVTIAGQQQSIESDPTAALAYQLNNSPLYTMEIAGFLTGGVFTGLDTKNRKQDGIFMMQPYKAGKIPVVLVHGTASSPARWAELVNELNGDPKIREKFQVWVFIYNSGAPIAFSAGRLRTALTNTLKELDPDGKDPALQQMVVIGHSQGGLLTKLTAIDTGTKLWNLVSDTPFDKIKVDSETRTLLQQSAFYTPLPFVKRLVFISTPHHGAMLAAKAIVTDLAAKILTLPVNLMSGLSQLTALNSDARLTSWVRHPPTAIDGMNPNGKGLKIISSIPVTAVPVHSIIAVLGDGPKEEGDDGVVAYKSAHIDEAISEKIIHWGHSCQDQPETIEEVKRILFEHLETPDAARP